MRWRSVALALALAGAAGGLVVPRGHAQEMDQCYDLRWGRMGCVQVEEFNFADPALRENSRHRLRGTYVIVSNMTMEMVEVPARAAAADQTTVAGSAR
ncbi:MAG TPA: hypothetical protein VFB73_12160 [Chloroflexota bacterium]|nr:hypothetical protein [Chloroflexota bacterium]